MFLNMDKIENIILDLGSFSDRPFLIDLILRHCSDLQIAAVSNDVSVDIGKQISTLTPTCADEWIFFQSVILKAMESIGAHWRNTVFITGDAAHLKHASEIGLGTIGIAAHLNPQDRASIVRQLPDFILDRIESLPKVLNKELAGYGGELIACEAEGKVGIISREASLYFPSVGNPEYPNFPVHISGRYFGSSDRRHKSHALSALIYESKHKPETHASVIGSILAIGIDAVSNDEFDYVCAVPSRPGKTNRLEVFLQSAGGNKLLRKLQKSKRIFTDLLQCKTDYPDIKLFGAAQRQECLKNAFEATHFLEGKTVVIVDDVQSSGNTMNSAIQTLMDNGAKHCIPIVVAYHPYTVSQWSSR